MLLGLALFLSGCFCAPIAVEAKQTVDTVTIALRTTDTNYSSRIINPLTVAEQARRSVHRTMRVRIQNALQIRRT